MIQEDKDLLLQYLSASLPYGVECLADDVVVGKLAGIVPYAGELYLYMKGVLTPFKLDEVKPYLRSMDSLTEEERQEYANCGNVIAFSPQKDYLIPNPNSTDWLLEHHFDFRGLIEKGLAIKVTEENNPYKE